MHLNDDFLTHNPVPSTRWDINKFFKSPDNNINEIINKHGETK